MQEPLPIDLFATKHIEYVLILGFLALLLAYWRLLDRRVPVPATPLPPGRHGVTASGWFTIPLERFYHCGHTWARAEEDGLVAVGIDDFAQKLVGRPTAIELPSLGAELAQGAPATRLAVESKSVDVVAPIGGEVVERNEAVLADPGLVNRDPYGAGWLVKVRPLRFESDRTRLLQGGAAASWMDSMESKLRGRMSTSLGLLLQDGGIPVSGLARVLAGERWNEFAREFLLS
jgi:glycine cleavage system H lipoate-binding protein